MNRLLAALKDTNRLSVASLRSLYRKLAVKYHPDARSGSETEFVRLQSEYDQALKVLLSHGRPPSVRRSSHARGQFLRALYVYSVMYSNRKAHVLLPELIERAAGYSKHVSALLRQYQEIVVGSVLAESQGMRLREAHQLLLESIKTLAWFVENQMPIDGRLLDSYLTDLSERALGLEARTGKVLLEMGSLLKREAGGPRISVVSIDVSV